ncbi:prenylated flavin chaperone LpdD [Loigolactobacillus iwatensis]|uniref:prenylated flavin chaperone LpdD n=1 Tax=Loigolactobacillus iwatensis TaxID=1267156 RepID=UPI000F7F7CFF|nr:amino acid decarboxylase [Loigolactobacillus iwatensis]
MPKFTVKQTAYEMQLDLKRENQDLLLILTGGDVPHFGVVTTLTKTTTPATVRFPSHAGRLHKENVLTERLANKLQSQLTGTCTIIGGVHVNQITQAQIDASFTMVDTLANQALNWLNLHPAKQVAISYAKLSKPTK